jgi:hypothetical protein
MANKSDGSPQPSGVGGVTFNYLNIILMTDKEKIIVRNIANVRRLRSVQSEPAKPASEKSVKSNK